VYGGGVTERIIGAAIEVHRALGPGLLESTYESCLCHELRLIGLRVERQKAVPVVYRGAPMGTGYRVDLVVEGCVLVELKSVQQLDEIHKAQMVTYLKLSGYRVGLLINFNVPMLKDGIRRFLRPRSAPSALSP